MPSVFRDIYNVEMVARHFGKSPKTILRLIHAGVIHAAKLGKRWLIHRETIEAIDAQIKRGVSPFRNGEEET
jgi:excisionase family DNA binding protein